MSIFNKVTRGDLAEVKDALDNLAARVTRITQKQRSFSAYHAGFTRRLKKIELLLRAPLPSEIDEDDVEDEEEEQEETETLDRETQRIRLLNGQ